MMSEQVRLLLVVVGITILSGLGDSQGFIHASKIWVNNKLDWNELGKSAIGFAIGISLYWVALKYMNAAGIVSPEIQTLVWFSVTLLGVALISRNFRSEEHTSELQSRENLVCRLLLEKKKKKQ